MKRAVSIGAHMTQSAESAVKLPRDQEFRLADETVIVAHEENCWLVDTEQVRFFALDPVAAELVQRTLAAGEDEAVTRVADLYQMPSSQVREDWTSLRDRLVHERLLAGKEQPRRRTKVDPVAAVVSSLVKLMCWSAFRFGNPTRPANRFAVWALLTAAWLSVRILGWGRTIRAWRCASTSPASTADHLEPAVFAIDRLVRDVAARHPLNTECKERSLVVWLLIRAGLQLPSAVVIGVKPYPFHAHAWVTCGPWVLADERARCDSFLPVATFQ